MRILKSEDLGVWDFVSTSRCTHLTKNIQAVQGDRVTTECGREVRVSGDFRVRPVNGSIDVNSIYRLCGTCRRVLIAVTEPAKEH